MWLKRMSANASAIISWPKKKLVNQHQKMSRINSAKIYVAHAAHTEKIENNVRDCNRVDVFFVSDWMCVVFQF